MTISRSAIITVKNDRSWTTSNGSAGAIHTWIDGKYSGTDPIGISFGVASFGE